MAMRKSPGTDAGEDRAPLPEARYATVVTVHDKPTAVMLGETPEGVARTGICDCEACAATRLAELNLKFAPG